MNMHPKTIFFIAFLVFIAKTLSAQEWDGQGTQFNAESILRNQIVLPSSPEAASLGKFGNIPISPFTGSPQINIPLYQLNGRYLPWSVSLSYDVHAVKVDEVPSWTGLGWTLNGPGVITRSVVGDPDLKRNYFSPVQDLPAGAGEEIMEFQNPDQIIENNFLVSLVNSSASPSFEKTPCLPCSSTTSSTAIWRRPAGKSPATTPNTIATATTASTA